MDATASTKSASESSSCPMRLLLFLHRATRPSKKSKNKPKGRKPSAIHTLSNAVGSPRQYRNDEKMDMTPQKPVRRQTGISDRMHTQPLAGQGPRIPFMRVIRSARCIARTREKCPTSVDSSVFCLSIASHASPLAKLLPPQGPVVSRVTTYRAGWSCHQHHRWSSSPSRCFSSTWSRLRGWRGKKSTQALQLMRYLKRS